ncbi:LOW QUALITY PROTEIN: ornithine decarboxylase antizyme 1 [Zerene cesonia]|uniref:LOW QUALITY PROTEIN: ornithine decarboxylase antizyme 1 n=1 Tax=Zerene cesonia TaxID=33412 RepID=UPI0018E59544|nr:LOW QUALITY PROTEIN: ornithine decarboxylase antizyme 1 [Zerene cesonia]
MTKLIQQLNFSSSNYYDVAGVLIEPNAAKTKKYCGDDASLSSSLAGSKRSALSASDAECFSLCLGAGPLWWSDVPAHDTAPPGGVGSGASSPATPSTPTHDDNNRDLLSTLLWSSASSLSNSEESLASDVHPLVLPEQREATIRKILERKDAKAVKIDFKIYLTENTLTRWEAVVKGNTMYLRVPGVLQSGSKESFMLLLDFAEERLRCSNCIICVLKSRADRATLLRTFMFMGFQLLPPNSPLAAEIANPAYVFLHYNMQ